MRYIKRRGAQPFTSHRQDFQQRSLSSVAYGYQNTTHINGSSGCYIEVPRVKASLPPL